MNALPQIIQGGMGVSVSGWKLARAVSLHGGLGVISGTAIEVVVARQLQLGDIGGHLARAFAAFPFPEIAQKFWSRYFVPGGKATDAPFRGVPMHQVPCSPDLEAMTVVASFAAVHLAKEGHRGPVGFNLLCKIPLPTLPALFGAMLGGADVVLMGAGIPRTIPGALDDLAAGRPVELRLDVDGATPEDHFATAFDPARFCPGGMPALRRPSFLAIVSSSTLAMTLARKANGTVDGFVVEYPEAGGHNAPPRGGMTLDAQGQPVYGPRDRPDLGQISKLGIPFWLAGGFGALGKLAEAINLGAAGIQVGTAFAFCEESGIAPEIKRDVLGRCNQGDIHVFTDPLASPTGFPFKLVITSESALNQAKDRPRVCDLGYLRQFYRKPDGSLGYRCPGEPAREFLRKGGSPSEMQARTCICNGLMATAGLAQIRSDHSAEPPIITAGDKLREIADFAQGTLSYSAAQVLETLRRLTPSHPLHS
jgi:nitronate monooxygenase